MYVVVTNTEVADFKQSVYHEYGSYVSCVLKCFFVQYCDHNYGGVYVRFPGLGSWSLSTAFKGPGPNHFRGFGMNKLKLEDVLLTAHGYFFNL